jgi:predicted RNase H-like HicB family nuclease
VTPPVGSKQVADKQYTLLISKDDDGSLWGHFREFPGCFASGADLDELVEAAGEALEVYLEESQVEEESTKVVSLGSRRRRVKAKEHKAPVARELIMEA